jgi:hypothetical protein
MINLFFFAAETPAKKNAHALQARQCSTRRAYAKRELFPFSAIPVPWNVYPVKCKAYFTGMKPIPLGSAEKGKNLLL